MTFADLQRMKRVSDPQISPSGRWVMFSVTDVDLEKNTKVNHLWVVPMAGENVGEGDAFPCEMTGREMNVRSFLEGGRVGGTVFAGWQAGAVYLGGRQGTSSQIYLARGMMRRGRWARRSN